MRFRRLIAMVAALCLLAGAAVAAFASESLPWGPPHWAQGALNRWAVLDREERWRSDPDSAMTLGDTALLFAGLLRLETGDGSQAAAAAACAAAGVMDVRAANPRGLGDAVSRQGFFAILARALHIAPETESEVLFEDTESVSPEVRGEVNALLNRGYLYGVTDTQLMPGGVLTRAEALSLLDRVVAEWIISDSAMVDAHGGILVVAARDVIISGAAEQVIAADGVKDSALTLEDLTVDRGVALDVPAALLLTGATDCGGLSVGPRAGGARIYIGESAVTGEVALDAQAEFMMGTSLTPPEPPEPEPTPAPAPEPTPVPEAEVLPETDGENELPPEGEVPPEGENFAETELVPPAEDAAVPAPEQTGGETPEGADPAEQEGEAAELPPEAPPAPGSVQRARVLDYSAPGWPPYDTYTVTAQPAAPGVTGYDVLVNLSMTGLRPHRSNGGGAGWWTGFSVTAPERAEAVVAEYSSNGVTYGRPVADTLTDGSYSHFFDAVRWNTYYVRLTWAGERLTEEERVPVTYLLDFSGVECDVSGLTDPESPMGTLGVASLLDRTEGANHKEKLFDSYGLTVAAVKDRRGGYLELTVGAYGLESHLSGGGRGYWAGFSAAAPEGALSCRYIANRSLDSAKDGFASTPLLVREDFYENVNGFGARGILQKSDAGLTGQRDYWVVLQWYGDLDGRTPLTAPEIYHVVIDATFR